MTRLNYAGKHLALVQPLIDFAHAANEGIEPALIDLIETRASQMNGCAVCLQMHTKSARGHGVSEEKLQLLAGWREAPHFNDRERAALAWTEAVTTLQPGGVSDDIYSAFAAQFNEEEQVRITLAVGAINVFNRLNVAFAMRARGPRD